MDKNDSCTENRAMSLPYDTYLSGEYLEKNPSWDDEDSEWKAGKVLDIIRANKLTFQSIADIGCGAGGVLAMLSKALPRTKLYGYEIAPDASGFWEQYEDLDIDFMIGDFLQESTKKFDAILLLDVFEHVPNPFEFLTALLGRSEHYILHIPFDLSSISVARETPLLRVRDKVGHIHYYAKNLALTLLKECGYDIIDCSYTGASFSAPQATWKGRLARLPRRLLFALNRDLGVRLLGGDTLIVLAKANRN
jgi:SAM-dependent methyltransferase